MDTLGLVAGQLLICGAGCALTYALFPSAFPGRHALAVGYGYICGTLLLTLWMRLTSAIGIEFSWMSIGLPLAAMMLGIGAVAYRRREPGSSSVPPLRQQLRDSGMPFAIALWWTLVALVVAHLVLSGIEIVSRPVFPWDAWTQWATKARVWYEAKRIVPFGDVAAWLAGNVYSDAAPRYPANVPLLEVWACISLGRWSDSLMNVPFLGFAAGLSLGFYGQCRYAGMGPLSSLGAAYALVSLPFVDTHVALAGYADLPLAVYFGLAAIALWQWSQTRDRAQLALAVVLAIACPLTKNPGWIWIATLLPIVIVTLFRQHGFRIVLASGVLITVALIALSILDVTIFSYHLGTTFHPVWEPLWENYFKFANWHLLWYVLPIVVVLQYRRLLEPPFAAGTLCVASGLAFLFYIFFFSSAADWVADYSTVNRATLHLAPLLVFFLWRLADDLVRRKLGERQFSLAGVAAPVPVADVPEPQSQSV